MAVALAKLPSGMAVITSIEMVGFEALEKSKMLKRRVPESRRSAKRIYRSPETLIRGQTEVRGRMTEQSRLLLFLRAKKQSLPQ